MNWKTVGFGAFGFVGSSAFIESYMTRHVERWDYPVYEPPPTSLVLPAYNEEFWLPKTLESLQNQNVIAAFPERFEYILVDSGSTDRTVEIAESYGWRVIQAPRGKLTSRNIGIREAEGEIIVALDADCFYPCNVLNMWLAHFRNPNVVAVSGSEIITDSWIWRMQSVWFSVFFLFNPRMMGRGCYAEGTEVLTSEGWKKINKVNHNDQICTLNPKTQKIEFQRPVRKFRYKYTGKMVRIRNPRKTIDLLVTPEHKFFVERFDAHHVHSDGNYYPIFVEAKDLVSNDKIPCLGTWIGKEVEYFQVPSCLRKPYGKKAEEIKKLLGQGLKQVQIAKLVGCHKQHVWNVVHNRVGNPKQLRAIPVKIEDWLKFFGIWLAEGTALGSAGGKTPEKRGAHRVLISQKNKQKRRRIRSMLDKLPFNYWENERAFILCNKQLWSYLRTIGNKYQKFIPKEIKALSPRLLKILLEWMMMGDGHKEKSGVRNDGKWRRGCMRYWTSSKRLADDVQEIALKIGLNARIVVTEGKSASIKGRKVRSNKGYEVRFRRSPYFHVKKKYVSTEHYNGYVHSLEVPNHIMYVRYNGIPIWSGNSAFEKSAYYETGGFDLSINQFNIWEMVQEEEINFRRRLQQVGKYVYDFCAPVYTTARRVRPVSERLMEKFDQELKKTYAYHEEVFRKERF